MRKVISFLILLFFIQPVYTYSQSISKPEILKFGETKSQIMLDIYDVCKIVNDIQIDPVTLPTATKTQSQLDCKNFKYAGKRRDIELIFADGILDMVWILTQAEEEDSLIAGLELYGEPTHIKKNGTFFLGAGVGVRNDPPEVLFISDRLKASHKVWIDKDGE